MIKGINLTILLIALPVFTGICAAFWGKLVTDNSVVTAWLMNSAAQIVFSIWYMHAHPQSWPHGFDAWVAAPAYFILSIVVSYLWVASVTDNGGSLSISAFVEIAWVIPALITSYLLIGDQKLTMLHIVGALFCAGGAGLVIYANYDK